jgi:hypothetical protein
LRCNIVNAQACQFRNSKAGAHREVQYSPISNSYPRGWIRSVEQSLHFFLAQIRHQTLISFLEGDRQNAANLPDGGWLTVLQKPEERTEGG